MKTSTMNAFTGSPPRYTAIAMIALALTSWLTGSVRAQTPSPVVIAAPAQRFDIDVEDAPARAFFSGLGDTTAHNILVHPEVSGRVSVKLKQVTIEQVLDAMRDLYGYDYRQVSSGYMVLPATIQTRIFRLNYLDLQRVGVSKTRVSSGQITEGTESDRNRDNRNQSSGEQQSQDGETREITGTSVLTRNVSDFWTAIEANVAQIIGSGADGRSVVINKQSGVIVVRAMPNELRDVADYIAQTQRTVTRQVVLEAKIVEIELNSTYQAGINWAAVLRDGNRQYTIGQRTPPGGFDSDMLAPPNEQIDVSPGTVVDGFINETLGGAFAVAANFADFNAYIELLKLQGRTRVLSSPRVSTLHNQKAVIKAGTDEFFVTGIESDTTTGTATTTTIDLELTPFFSGVALDVTPQISEDGRILLHIHPTVSDVTDQQKTIAARGVTDVLPLALSQVRESDSIVQARSGQVIVIGGLMRESRRRSDYKTPLLGDIPLAGRLFRSERDQTVTTELVILMRPVIVEDGEWPAMVDTSMQRIDELTRKGKVEME